MPRRRKKPHEPTLTFPETVLLLQWERIQREDGGNRRLESWVASFEGTPLAYAALRIGTWVREREGVS